MRKNSEKQMPLMPPKIDHPQAEELDAISRILDRNPIIYDLAMQDLSSGSEKSNAGARGMTAEQVVRAAIVKQMFEFSYKDLAFHPVDSVLRTIRAAPSAAC
jgi:IS5 family transposase